MTDLGKSLDLIRSWIRVSGCRLIEAFDRLAMARVYIAATGKFNVRRHRPTARRSPQEGVSEAVLLHVWSNECEPRCALW